MPFLGANSVPLSSRVRQRQRLGGVACSVCLVLGTSQVFRSVHMGEQFLRCQPDTCSRRSALLGVGAPAVFYTTSAAAESSGAARRTCEPTVSHYSGDMGDVFLVGVAHVSNKSAELVKKAINVASPDLVMVELDSGRMGLEPTDDATKPALGPVSSSPPPSAAKAADSDVGGQLVLVEPAMQQGVSKAALKNQTLPAPPPWEVALGAVLGAAKDLAVRALRTALETLYRQMETYLDVTAGSEMITALKESAKAGVPVLLGDQPARITLSRLTEEAASVDFDRLDEELSLAVPEVQLNADSPSALQAVLEGYRDQATTRRLRRGFKAGAPGLFRALVDERDAYMARNLLEGLRAGRRRIVAVVGSIHVEGIGERLAGDGRLRPVDTCLY